ncbi:hypothetical protein QOT17_010779 [Balamuthia mandrillaris]
MDSRSKGKNYKFSCSLRTMRHQLMHRANMINKKMRNRCKVKEDMSKKEGKRFSWELSVVVERRCKEIKQEKNSKPTGAK